MFKSKLERELIIENDLLRKQNRELYSQNKILLEHVARLSNTIAHFQIREAFENPERVEH
jgi:hypothetical protein